MADERAGSVASRPIGNVEKGINKVGNAIL